jgi:hypothetical protein
MPEETDSKQKIEDGKNVGCSMAVVENLSRRQKLENVDRHLNWNK